MTTSYSDAEDYATASKSLVDLGHLSGYDTHDRYVAAAYDQGGRTVYAFDLSLAQVVNTLPKPDPDVVVTDNRRINVRHAREFAEYVREKPQWIAPSLLLRVPTDTVVWTAVPAMQGGGVCLGILEIPRNARPDLRILDGQHRILGLHFAMEGIASDLVKARQKRKIVKGSVPANIQAEIDHLHSLRDRFTNERISVQLVAEDDEEAYRQMFIDIAANVKGVTKTIENRFDTQKVVNRALTQVVHLPLLEGRIEEHDDRVRSERQLLAAKHVADIIRTVARGAGGRMSKKQEEALDEADLVAKTQEFCSVLAQGFPEIQAIIDRQLTPGKVREQSMLGWATTLRVLAGAYHNLSTAAASQRRGQEAAHPLPMSGPEIVGFFRQLAPHMGAPVTAPLWIDTGYVKEGASAPQSRGGDIQQLAEIVAGWARAGLPGQTTTGPA